METSLQSPSIQAIDKTSVHKICSGQVVLNLAMAVKELVENSVDAGSKNIEVKLKEHGSELVEVSDDGLGVEESNFEGLTLKHHTSKLKDFSDLSQVGTFGFRGEALSSLCALSDVVIATCHKSSMQGTLLKFDHNGRVIYKAPCARQVGTTVSLHNLFYTFSVRHKEFLSNVKREFNKMLRLLTGYCIVCTGVKIVCSNIDSKGKKQIVLSTQGSYLLKDNIAGVFGSKQLNSLLQFKQLSPGGDVLEEYSLTEDLPTSNPFKIEGFISSCAHGNGRSSADRQFYFINSRPCDLPKLSKVVNEVYHMYNRHQYPFVLFNIILKKETVDVNVTPDKRTIFIHQEKLLLATVKSSLIEMFKPIAATYEKNKVDATGLFQQQSPISSFLTQSPKVFGLKRQLSDESSSNKLLSFKFRRFAGSQPSPDSCSPVLSCRADSDDIISDASQNSSQHSFGYMNSSQETSLEIAQMEISSSKNSQTTIAEMTPDGEDILVINDAIDNSLDKDLETSFKSNSDSNGRKDESSALKGLSQFIFQNKSGNCSFSDKEKHLSSPPVIKENSSPPAIKEILTSRSLHELFRHKRDSRPVPKDQPLTKNNEKKSIEISSFFEAKTTEEDDQKSSHDSYGKSPIETGSETVVSNCIVIGDEADTSVNKNLVSQSDEESPVKLGISDKIPKKNIGVDISWNSVDSEHSAFPVDEQVEKSKQVREFEFSLERLRQLMEKRSASSSKPSYEHGRKFRASISPTDNETAEAELQKEISKDMFLQMKIIGQFNLGFIIAQLQDDLFIIDQHATDEKYNFEMLQKSTVMKNQQLIVPLPLELTAVNESVLLENMDIFKKNGFDFVVNESHHPGRRVNLTSVPVSGNWQFGREDVEELIFMLNDSLHAMCRPSKVQKMFASKACRKSVMIGTALTHSDMKKIVTHMGEIDHPWNCPHGRPTMRHLFNLALLPG